VEIGDVGLKNGCDGIDNGWMMFDKYKVPKSRLLNKYADVLDDGTYVSEIKSNNQ
jgi:acyl-CoA oxidase